MLHEVGHSGIIGYSNTAAIVEASDIPILSSTDRLQRALLRWVEICGLAGQYQSADDVVASLQENSFLDDTSYLLEIESYEPDSWAVLWSGQKVSFVVGANFQEALMGCIPDHRFVNLVMQEYLDAEM